MDDPAALSSSALTGDEAIAKLAESVGEDAVKALKSANWNERLHAMADIVEKAPGIAAGGGGDALVFGLAALPGWSEKNFQVLGKAFEVCRITAEQTDARFGKVVAFLNLSISLCPHPEFHHACCYV